MMSQAWTALQSAAVLRLKPGPPRTVFPDVRCDLIWNGDGWTFTGPQSRPRFQVVSRAGLLISLEPLAARQVLGTPLRELVDLMAPVEDVSPVLARRLAGAMAGPAPLVQTPLADARLAAAERMLRTGATVATAAAAAELSPRQLERRFTEELGLRPKTFARIVRFRRACDWFRREASLADAAAGAGYADQSHLARECRTLGAVTPAALRSYVANVQDVVQGDFASSAETGGR